jgi:nucleoside-diphosphate-sugar epimerase
VAHVLVAGLGDLGSALAERMLAAGHRVSGIRRGDRAPSGVDLYSQDLAEGMPVLPPDQVDLVYIILTPEKRDEAGYRRAFVQAPARLLHALAEAQPLPPVIFVSSTAVFGDVEDDVDEDTPPRPERFNGKVLLAAEEELSTRAMLTVVRFSGLYGGPSRRLLRQLEDVANGAAPPAARWSNRMHRRDAVRLLVHLGEGWLAGEMQPSLVVGSDGNPVNNREVLNWLAEQRGEPVDIPPGSPTGKRITSRYLAESDFELEYPDFRSGYAEMIEGARREERGASD